MRGKLQVHGCNSTPEDDALSAIHLSFGEDASSSHTARAAPPPTHTSFPPSFQIMQVCVGSPPSEQLGLTDAFPV